MNIEVADERRAGEEGATRCWTQVQLARPARAVAQRDNDRAARIDVGAVHRVVYKKRCEEALDSALTLVMLALIGHCHHTSIFKVGDQFIHAPPVI